MEKLKKTKSQYKNQVRKKIQKNKFRAIKQKNKIKKN